MKPTVSVIIPCFNAQAFISAAIQSVLNQDFDAFEILVIDDGSTDDSKKEVLKYRDSGINYFYQENQGVSAARNTGINKANGKYLAFLDADDLFRPENLLSKVSFLDANPNFGLVHSWEEEFESETGQKLRIHKGCGGKVTEDLLELSKTVVHSPSSVVCRAELVLLTGGFDTRMGTSADWDMWIRLSQHTQFGIINEVLVDYRSHPGQMHLSTTRMERDTIYGFRKYKKMRLFRDERHFRRCRNNLYLILAASFWGHEKNIYKTLRYLFLPFVQNPGVLFRRMLKR